MNLSEVFLGIIAARDAGDGADPDRRHRRRRAASRGTRRRRSRRCSRTSGRSSPRSSALADEASKTATLATAQAEKIDQLVTDLTRRVDETSTVVQQAIITPAREGMAIIAALKAGFGALRGFRDMRASQARHAEDEDPLFIG